MEVEACRLPVSGNKPFVSLQRTFSSASLVMQWVCPENFRDERNVVKATVAFPPLVERTYLRTQGNHLLFIGITFLGKSLGQIFSNFSNTCGRGMWGGVETGSNPWQPKLALNS